MILEIEARNSAAQAIKDDLHEHQKVQPQYSMSQTSCIHENLFKIKQRTHFFAKCYEIFGAIFVLFCIVVDYKSLPEHTYRSFMILDLIAFAPLSLTAILAMFGHRWGKSALLYPFIASLSLLAVFFGVFGATQLAELSFGPENENVAMDIFCSFLCFVEASFIAYGVKVVNSSRKFLRANEKVFEEAEKIAGVSFDV